MITLTTIDGTPMRFNPDRIAVSNTEPFFAMGDGTLASVTRLWMGGDEPFYVRESEAEIDRIIFRDGRGDFD